MGGDVDVLVPGSAPEPLRAALAGWNPSFVVFEDGCWPDELPDPGLRSVAWLSPRASIDASTCEAVQDFLRQGPGRCAFAEHFAESAAGRVPLGARALVATAGGALWSSAGPSPVPGAGRVRLPGAVRLAVPPGVGAHLQAINAESSAGARLGLAVGDVPRWTALAAAPLVGALRGWWGASGERDRAFTAAFVESFLAAATAAKLWEAQHPETEPPA